MRPRRTCIEPRPAAVSGQDRSQSVVGSASIGDSGTKSRGAAAARAAAPPARAIVATRERSPRKSAARLTAAGSAPAARPIASSTSPSDTPVRISPVMILRSQACSGPVARAASAVSRSSRMRRDPVPVAVATAAKARSTSARVRDGTAAGPAGGRARTPSTRGSDAENARPVRYATAPAASSGPRALRKSVTSRSLSSRPGVDSRARQSVTRADRLVMPSQCTGPVFSSGPGPLVSGKAGISPRAGA